MTAKLIIVLILFRSILPAGFEISERSVADASRLYLIKESAIISRNVFFTRA